MAQTSKGARRSLTIETIDDIARGCRSLRRRCPHMRAIHSHLGNPPLRRREAGFPGLARIIVGQQLSIASANAIWTRVQSGIDPFEPAEVLCLDENQLRSLGLSQPKIRTLRALASAAVSGEIDFRELPKLKESDLRDKLTALPGIGPWTADIYLMFCIGARDAFASGDLALQEATRMILKMKQRPTAPELEAIAERWRPWRGVAARLLWADYGQRRLHARKQP